MSYPDVSRMSESDVTRWCPQEIPWKSEIGWDEWSQILTKQWLLILMSLGQFMDIGPVFWCPLDVLWMSDMSCECQIVTKDGHVKFWPKYNFLTSPEHPVVVRNVWGRSDSDQTSTLWADGCSGDVSEWYIMPNLAPIGCPPDVQTDIRFWHLSMEKSVRKRRLIDFQFWHQADQNLTS